MFQLELAAVLLEAFGDRIQALRETVMAIDPSGALVDHLESGAPAKVVHSAVEVLDRHGLFAEPRTWRCLAEAAPTEADEIYALAAGQGHEFEHLGPPTTHALPDVPFKDLEPFTEQDASIFFGRRQSIHALLFALRGAESQVVLVFGPTGVGKSSVLHAGVLPRMQAESRALYVRHAANTTLLGSVQKLLGERDIASAWSSEERACGCLLVVVLDQIEAAYTSAGGEPRGDREMTDLLDALFGAYSRMPVAGKLVLSVRKEWVTDVRRSLEQRGVIPQQVEIPRLDRASIREIILGPTRRSLQRKYRLTYEPEVVEQITHDILYDESSPIAPTLQILLTQLWQQCAVTGSGERVITLKQYRELGRREERFKIHIEQRLRSLDAGPAFRTRVDAGLALDLLFECTTQARTARVLAQTELERSYGRDIGALIDACVEARLLRRETSDGAQPVQVSLTHDTVAPVVRRLFRESPRDGQRARRLLTGFVDAYAEGSTDTGAESGAILRLRPGDLEILERGRPGMRLLTEVEQKIIAVNRLSLDEEAAQAERARRGRRRLRYITAGVVLLIAAIGGYSVVESMNRRDLEAAQRVRGLAVRAADTSERGYRALGALLAVRAYRDLKPSNHTELSIIDATLREALSTNLLQAAVSVGPRGVRAMAVAADGTGLLAAALPSRLAMFVFEGSALRLERRTDEAGVNYGMAHHPRLGWAVAGCDGVIRVWAGDIEAAPDRRFEVPMNGSSARCLLALAVDAVGEHILAGGASGELYEWPAEGGPPVVLSGLDRAINAVAYGPDGWIAAGDDGGVVAVGRRGDPDWRRLESHRPIHALVWQGPALYVGGESDTLLELVPGGAGGSITLKQRRFKLAPGGAPTTLAMAAVPEDSRIATAHVDGTVRLWRIPAVGDIDGLGVIPGTGQPVRALQFVAERELLVTASDDGVLRTYTWQMPPVSQLAVGLVSRGSMHGVDTMRVIDGDGESSLWRRQGDNGWLRAVDPEPPVRGVFTSSNGQWSVQFEEKVLAVQGAGAGRTISVEQTPTTVAIDDTGRRVAAVFGASEIRLWSAIQDEPEQIPSSAQDTLSALAFSGDGEWLAVGGRSGDKSLVRVLATGTSHMPPIDLDSSPGRVVGLGFLDGDASLVALKDRGEIRVIPLTRRLADQACDSFAGAVSEESWRLAVADDAKAPCALGTKSVAVATPLPAEPDPVLFTGCSELRSPLRCVADEQRPLVFWIPPTIGLAERVLIDGVDATQVVIEDRRVSVRPPADARMIGLVGADGRVLFQLSLASGASSPDNTDAWAALGALKIAGRRFEADPRDASRQVEEMERLAEDAVQRCRQAGLLSCQADAGFVFSLRMIEIAADPGRALAWLDAHPLLDGAEASELGFDTAYARGAALRALSSRVALDAAWWLQRATSHGSRLALDYQAQAPSMELYADTLYRLGRAEDALHQYDEMARIAPDQDACIHATNMHNRAALRLEILRDGGRHDALADFTAALALYAAIADEAARDRCLDPTKRATIEVDMALAACLQGDYEAVARLRARIDPATITSRVLAGTLQELEGCVRALEG